MNNPGRDDVPRFGELEAEYEILRELGRGGTAVVYLARERELDRSVAIKVIRSTYIEDAEAAARLMREARTVGGLQHPNIVMLYGTRRLRDSSLALIMQYIAGRTLRDVLREQGRLPFDRVHNILRDLGNALLCAHRHRIVHRDVKPENIYLDDESGAARLSDFGIARSWDSTANLTVPGTAIGTPAYMSPEQIEGGVLDGRSDLYSLGLVGYEMLTGSAPWSGESLYSIIYKQKHEPPPALELLRAGIPLPIRHAIEGALQKAPDERWADPDEFLRALQGGPAAAREIDAAEPTTAGTGAQAAAAELRDGDTRAAAIREGSVVGVPTEPDGVTIRFRPAEAAGPPVTWEVAVEPAGSELQLTGDAATQPHALPAPARAPRRRAHRVALALLALGLFAVAGTLTATSWTRRSATNVAARPPFETAGASAAVAAPLLVDSSAALAPTVAAEDAADHSTAAAAAALLLGDMQRGFVGDTLPERLLLRVTDADGEPLEGATVRFAIGSGTSTVVSAETTSDAFGIAATRWLLRSVGDHSVVATIDSSDVAPVTIRATAVARMPAELAAASDTVLRPMAGSRVLLAVAVADDRGSPLRGIAVRFEVRAGDGTVEDSTLITAADGTARAEWRLGTAPTQEVIATTADLPEERVRFRAAVGAARVPIRSGLTVGGTHTCGLDGDGAARCWGGNDSGQLGDGSAARRSAAVRVAAPEPLASISAGVAHTCAVGGSGGVFCWGANSAGQLGTGGRTASATPARVATLSSIATVAAGMSHSCALDVLGRLFCWGQNTHGQLGNGRMTDQVLPVRAGGDRTFRSVTVGWAHTCALDTGRTAWCWGRNASGELGVAGGDRSRPEAVAGAHAFTSIAAGSSHTCAIRTNGAVLCWGQNTHGQLGVGGTEPRATPTPVSSLAPFTAVVVGGVHTCALTREGTAYCWGRNTYGQLGDGTTEDATAPTAVAGGHRFSSLSASGAHTCGTDVDGTRYCWGFNVEGQLGNGTRVNSSRPVAVARLR